VSGKKYDNFNTMPKTKISIVIPAHNEEKYIGECLDCAIKSSNGEVVEIIAVDNASTDNTFSIAQKKQGVRVIKEEKKGVMHARQKGYFESTGDIVVFIDADCRMSEKWINRVISEFEQDKNLACLSGPYQFYDLSKTKKFLVGVYWLMARPLYWLIGYMAVFGNFAIRREVLEKMNGLDTTIEFYGDDTNTARRASEFGKSKFIFNHYIYSSGRRLNKQGIINLFKEYGLNFFSEVILHRPVNNKEYKGYR
jgi:glycosyltransferase involved in cell wall biosynthesis